MCFYSTFSGSESGTSPIHAPKNTIDKDFVLLYNRSTIEEIDGELVCFDPTFEGKGEKMKWPGERSLFLKGGCKVILL